ncbi:phosphoribosylglycinamide formyltransferase [Spirochaetota bacterium]
MFNKRISFLVSGKGIIFSSVARKICSGDINAKPGILISDNENSQALTKATEFGIKPIYINPDNYSTREECEKEMLVVLRKYKTDLIVTAGYMRIISPYLIKIFKNRIINIHPSLLPSFPGKNAQQKALDYGVKVTGCTSHFIDEGIDSGPIIMQRAVPVFEDDDIKSLSLRIIKEECKILPESVNLYCRGRLKMAGRRVIIK